MATFAGKSNFLEIGSAEQTGIMQQNTLICFCSECPMTPRVQKSIKSAENAASILKLAISAKNHNGWPQILVNYLWVMGHLQAGQHTISPYAYHMQLCRYNYVLMKKISKFIICFLKTDIPFFQNRQNKRPIFHFEISQKSRQAMEGTTLENEKRTIWEIYV